MPRIAVAFLLCIPCLAMAAEPATPEESPAQIWARLEKTLIPLEWTIQKDEIVTSDTDPTQKLRRVELKFYSQELEGRKWGHPCVVFIPADRAAYMAPGRRGKVVIVGQRSWDGLATGPWRGSFLGNYGEPIAARTGYPTMICPVPGEYDGEDGRELSIGYINGLYRTSGDLADHPHFRIGVPYLRALDVMADLLKLERGEIRAVIGGHSKRGTPAYTVAAADPRIVGVVYMGNESYWRDANLEGPDRVMLPPYTQKWVKAPTLYIGGTNEDGYSIFAINNVVERMHPRWSVEMVPNYRHASQSEKHPLDWMMWIAHCFEGRPITQLADLGYEEKGPDFEWGGRKYGAGGGTLFRCRIDSPNKIIQAKVWYVYNDDPPYWRDLMWYPEFMVSKGDGVWEGYVKGKLPDAWMVEVKDTAMGYPGYVSTLLQDITHKEIKRRTSRGSRSPNWAEKPAAE